MHIRELHPWNIAIAEAMEIQKKLGVYLNVPCMNKKPTFIAGADVSVDSRRNLLYGGIVVCNYDTLAEIESHCAVAEATFPYVPGLLSFREVPVLLEAFQKVKVIPDIILCDGQGIAHPRGFGLACHLGMILDIPTIGCAKSRLCGEHLSPVPPKKGDFVELFYQGNMIGLVMRTRDNVQPLYISVGYKIALGFAKQVVLQCCRRYRVPEPNRKAHMLVNLLRKKSP